MKKILFVLAALLSLAGLSYSQAPGYMGKRLLVAGEFASIPILVGLPNHNFEEGPLNFSIRGVFDLDYVTTRRGSIGLTINTVSTSMNYSYDSLSYRVIDSETEFAQYAQIKGMSYCINFKIFHGSSKGAIAPVGNYSKFGIGVIHYKTVPYVKEFDYLDKTNTERFITPIFTYAYGKQRVLFNNVIFRTSAEIGIVPSGILYALDYYYTGGSDPVGTHRSKLKQSANLRLTSYYLLNFNIGVGFLLPVK